VIEIYYGESRIIYFDLIGTTADSLPTATLVRGTTSTPLAVTHVTTPPSGVADRYSAYISLAEIGIAGDFRVFWDTTAGSEPVHFKQYYRVVVPYMIPADLAVKFGWQYSDPTLPGYMDQDRVEAAELVARSIINIFAEQSFGESIERQTTYGTKTDVLVFKKRISAIQKIYENGILIYDATVLPVFNHYGYTYEITETNFGIRIIAPIEDISSSNSLGYDTVEYERVSLVYNYGKFAQGYRYEVEGAWGFEKIPPEIHEAAAILINELMCQDSTYQNKYVEAVQTKDWRFAYSPLVWMGTGNSLVDNLISTYKIQPVWVI
jgi:hypothetical protein